MNEFVLIPLFIMKVAMNLASDIGLFMRMHILHEDAMGLLVIGVPWCSKNALLL